MYKKTIPGGSEDAFNITCKLLPAPSAMSFRSANPPLLGTAPGSVPGFAAEFVRGG